MSFEITTAFTRQYSANVQLLAQQKGSRLRRAVRVESQVGEHGFYDQIAATAAVARSSRHADTPLISTPHSRRRVTLIDYVWADLIDDVDKAKTVIDPTSAYALNAAGAMGRAMDDVIIAAARAAAATGVDGGTSTPFDTANNRIADGSTGMTVAKLLEAKEILDGHEVDDERRYVALSSKQVSDLLNTTEVKSSDYNTVKALAQGQINNFLGFEFIRSERLESDGADTRYCLAFAQQGLLLAVGAEPVAKITERPDKNHATQVYFSMSLGAARMAETDVVEIQCLES